MEYVKHRVALIAERTNSITLRIFFFISVRNLHDVHMNVQGGSLFKENDTKSKVSSGWNCVTKIHNFI